MSQTMVSVSIVTLLYVPAALIFNVTCFEWEVQFENYLVCWTAILQWRWGWDDSPCSADEIILSAQKGTLKLESTCANRPTHSDLQLVCYGWWLASSFCWYINLEAPLNRVWPFAMRWIFLLLRRCTSCTSNYCPRDGSTHQLVNFYSKRT